MDRASSIGKPQQIAPPSSTGEKAKQQSSNPRVVSSSPIIPSLPDSVPKTCKVTPAVDRAVLTIRNDTDRQSVLAFCRQEHPGQPVLLIRTPDDLQQHQLLQTVVCTPDGKLPETPGRLFNGQPVTLVLDLTEMSPSQIASLNDLLDTPPKWEKQQLSEAVRRICLVGPEILTGGLGKPGPDCLRRLKKFANQPLWPDALAKLKSSLSEPVIANSAELTTQIQPAPCPPDKQELWDLGTNNWRTLLFGGLALDDRGQSCFQTGRLAELQPGARLTLVDAPWESAPFTDALATALRENGFEANNQWVSLPEGLQLFRQETGADQLAALKTRLVQGPEHLTPEQPFVCLSGTTLDSVLNNSQIHKGVPHTVDTLQELCRDTEQIFITGPLSDQQWRQLLRRLEKLAPRPTVIDLSLCQQLPPLPSTVPCQIYQHRLTALAGIPEEQALIYSITGAEQWPSLWQELRMVSRKGFRFAQHDTPLLEALKNGTPVVFEGLHRLPKMLAHFDSLLASPPYLWIHGEKITLPRANITLLWPDIYSRDRGTGSLLPPFWQARTHSQQSTSAARQQLTNQIKAYRWLNRLEFLPQSTTDNSPKGPPWTSLDFAALLDRQIAQERDLDRASSALPVHTRRALHTLIAKRYRGNRKIYDYLKTAITQWHPDTPADLRADRDALGQWLAQHPDVDRQGLEQHFWSLVRHCPITGAGIPIPDFPQDPPQVQAINLVASYLIGCAPSDQQAELATRLGIKGQEVKGREHLFSGQRRSRLRDALLVAGPLGLQADVPISQQVRQLDAQIEGAIAGLATDQAVTAIDKILRQVLPSGLLDQDFADLPQALLVGHGQSRLRQLRRMQRLTDRVAAFPLVHLQGESGAGKSHMAEAAAAQLRQRSGWTDTPEPLVLSLGPQTQASDLYGRQQLRELTNGDTDTRFEPGPLLQWAQQINPPVLIIKDANLASEGLLAPLAGSTENPPVLRYQGQIHRLSPHHRVITTADPNGPPMDSILQGVMLTLHYRPLAPDTLAELMVAPALPKDWPNQLKGIAVAALMTLYRQFSHLLPEALTPRDLQDLLAHIQLSLTFVPSDQPITQAHCHALVWQACYDALVGQVPIEQRPRLQALEHWYQAHFPGERAILAAQEHAFDTFYRALRQRFPQVDLESGPVVKLVRYCWLFLKKQQRNSADDRRFLIVEGPAGWGKDLLLNCVLCQWEAQHPPEDQEAFIHTSAKPSRWGVLVKTMKQAMARGQKLVISELNLLPSHALEGLLNNLLRGPKTAGFALLATVNPCSFAGREPFVPAIKNRANRWQVSPLSATDLSGILHRRRYPEPMVAWLVCRFVILERALINGETSIQLTLDDLLATAEQLHTCPASEWPARFAHCCTLELQALSWSGEQLEHQVSQQTPAPEDGGLAERQRSLSAQINSQQLEPLAIHLLDRDATPYWEPGIGTLALPDTGDLEEMLVIAAQALKSKTPPQGGLGDGVITKPRRPRVVQYFASDRVDPRYYRLQLKQLVIGDGTVNTSDIPPNQNGVTALDTPGWSQAPLAKGQYEGSGTFSLSNRRWHELPGLSADDQLIRIRCRESLPLAIARGNNTGQLLVKLADTVTMDRQVGKPNPHARIEMCATLDYVIEPKSSIRSTPPLFDYPSVLDDNRFDPAVKARLDQELFSVGARVYPGCRELQKIWRSPAIGTRLTALVQWCHDCRSDKDIPGQGLDLLIAMIREHQGVCRHRSQIFCLLAAYMGLSTRIVHNDCHQYVEIRADGSHQWQGIDLGGGGSSTLRIYKWDFVNLGQAYTGDTEQTQEPDSPESWSQPERYHVLRKNTSDDQELALFVRELEPLLDSYRQGTTPQDNSHAWGLLKNFFQQPRNQYRCYLSLMYRSAGEAMLRQIFADNSAIAELICGALKTLFNTGAVQPPLGVTQLILVLLKIRDYHTNGVMKTALYLATNAELLERHWSDQCYTDTVLPLLEDLTSDQRWKVWAEARLGQFYRSLGTIRTWPLPVQWEDDEELGDLGGRSETLLKVLQQSSVDQQWSYLSQGEPPDISRLARGEKPFPVQREWRQPSNPVVIPWLRSYALAGDHMPTTPCMRHILEQSYQNWLTKLGREGGWQCLVLARDSRAQSGCYPISPEALYQGSCLLKPERLRQFCFPENTVLPTDNLLDQCYQEFVRSVDKAKLQKAVEARIAAQQEHFP